MATVKPRPQTKTDAIVAFIEAVEGFISTPGDTLENLQTRGTYYMAAQWAALVMLEKEK